MRIVTLVATLLLAPPLLAAPAFAADVPTAHPGDMVRDANKVRLGSVDAVNKDGSVGLIYESHYVTLPAGTLALVDGKLVTTLTKAQVSALK